jgi:hypothetical protein
VALDCTAKISNDRIGEDQSQGVTRSNGLPGARLPASAYIKANVTVCVRPGRDLERRGPLGHCLDQTRHNVPKSVRVREDGESSLAAIVPDGNSPRCESLDGRWQDFGEKCIQLDRPDIEARARESQPSSVAARVGAMAREA